jgi:hypothetical protein
MRDLFRMMLSTKRALDRHMRATAESTREEMQKDRRRLTQTRIESFTNLGATMQEQIAVLDIEELAHVGGGWGELDPGGA